jgi:hypothetical protein
VPIFPELRPFLEEAFEQAKPGEVYEITSKRDADQNLRTRFEKIIRRAGVTPWPKLFQNLRARSIPCTLSIPGSGIRPLSRRSTTCKSPKRIAGAVQNAAQ